MMEPYGKASENFVAMAQDRYSKLFAVIVERILHALTGAIGREGAAGSQEL